MARKKLLLAVQIILMIAFLFFGAGKFFVSPEDAMPVFGKIGGTPSQYFTGVYEMVAGILVVIPSTSFLGALMILVSMAVAILLHIFVIGVEGELLASTIIAVISLFLAIYVMVQTKNIFLKKSAISPKKKR